MKKSWIPANADEATEREIRSAYSAAALLRARLVEMLNDKTRVAEKEGRSKELYDSPNWAARQADVVGYTRALQDVISLIS